MYHNSGLRSLRRRPRSRRRQIIAGQRQRFRRAINNHIHILLIRRNLDQFQNILLFARRQFEISSLALRILGRNRKQHPDIIPDLENPIHINLGHLHRLQVRGRNRGRQRLKVKHILVRDNRVRIGPITSRIRSA